MRRSLVVQGEREDGFCGSSSIETPVRMIMRTASGFEPEHDQEWVVDDLSDAAETAEATRGTDALIGVCRTLAEAVEGSEVSRLLVVGGGGVLQVALGVTLLQSGKLPPEWVPIAASHSKALAALRESAVNWTYLAPAAFFEPGEWKGRYRIAGEHLVIDENGESRISMEDYAIAMVDELENAKYPRAVCPVGW